MRKILASFFIGLFGLVILPNTVLASQYDNLIELPVDQAQEELFEEDQGEVLGAMEMVDEISDLDVDAGPHFYFGEDVTVDEDLVGDVYVAGGNVEVNGMIDGDLLVAGGNVMINGEVTQDVRAAGGSVYINGLIGQNLSVAGGSILFDSQAMVGNSIVAGGGQISLDGEVLGRVMLGGGAARIAGNYGSDVNAQAETIEVAPGVVIAGSLMADAYTDVQVAEDVEVMGERVVTVTPEEEKKRVDSGKMESVGGVLVKASLGEFIVKLLMGVVSGSILLYFIPKFAGRLSKQAIESTMANIGWGLVYIIIAPIVILLALVSIVGIPLAGLMTLFYILTFATAKWVSAYAVGQKLAENLKIKALENKYLTFAVGLLVLNAVGYVPIIGWLVKMIAVLVGMGAIFTIFKTDVLSRKKK